MKKISIATHTALIGGKEYDGIGNVLIETMSEIHANFIFVRHSIDGRVPSVIREYREEKLYEERKLFVFRKPSLIRYISEIISTVCHFLFIEKVDVFLGVDPLNALSGIILKKIGRVEKCVFFTADYSPKRFKRNFLNNIYHMIDSFCVKNADSVWNVSNRIRDVRSSQGLPDSRNILVPNVPPTKFEFMKNNKRNKFRMITYGALDEYLDFAGIIEAVKLLSDEIPLLELVIIGSGPAEKDIKDKVNKLGLSRKVKLLGHLTLSDTLKEASKSGIGLALYTGMWSFNYYGDSTKCREYSFFGLPIMTTNSHSTVDEILVSRAGVVTEIGPNNYAKNIKFILNNYKEIAIASGKLGNKYTGIHKKLLLELICD